MWWKKSLQSVRAKKKVRLSTLLMALCLLGATWSCKDDEDGPEKTVERPLTLNSSTYVFSRDPSELKLFIDASGVDLPVEKMVYKVDFYKVEYTTTYKGNEIIASGVVMLPDTREEISTVSFQHGTIAANREAPTQLPLSDYQLILYQALASSGFVTVAPDYIGFGASAGIMHPYYVEDLSASVVIDNIYAALNLADEKDLNTSERLYLAGYSQGGFVTMAIHKAIEAHGIEGLELKASFPAAGGYEIRAVQEYFFEQGIYHQPFFIAYVAQAYNETFNWDTDLSMFFNDPYAGSIPQYFDGSLSGDQINDHLNDTLSVLLNENYLNHSDTDPAYTTVNRQFEENSLLDWTPQIRMHMYHGDADFTVPYHTSVTTYNHFLEQGASASVVSFTSLPGKTHGSGIFPYVELFVDEMLLLESTLK